MGWFRRSRTTPAPAEPDASGPRPDAPRPQEAGLVPVPPSSPELVRTERALQMLATQSAQLHASIVQLEHRVDAMSETMLDQIDRPTYEDMAEARVHTAKVAAELSRLEINIAARIDAVRAEVRRVPDEIDLRPATPVDTGW